MREISGQMGGIFYLIATLVYIRAIRRKETVPNRTTWFLWVPVSFAIFMAVKDAGGTTTLWVAGAEAFDMVVIALLSIWYGSTIREEGEFFSIAGASISLIVLFLYPGSAMQNLCLVLVADALATWPTIRKSTKHPEQEDKLTWMLMETGNLLNIFAAKSLTFEELLYPVVLFVLHGIVLSLLFFPREKEK